MNLINVEDFDITSIVLKFRIAGEISEVRSYGTGHINDTFLLKNSMTDQPDYLLQRINHHVFKNVPSLMANVARVIAHLEGKMKQGSDQYAHQKMLHLIPTTDEKLFYQDEHGNYWRIYNFIPGARSYDVAETEQQAFEAGKAFGYFQSQLSDMDPGLLSETIADFHNIEKRLRDFYLAADLDVAGRIAGVGAEMDLIKQHQEDMGTINRWGRAGILPGRITHNDTKFNNVLLDADDKAICIIDLDTVMTGYVAYDFGDAVRTIINTAPEDEPELDKIQLNIDLFSAYTQGYIQIAASFLTEKEVDSLFWGVLLLPYMQGVRFLTDYLQGDTYFKIAYPEHNLVRARAQFQLYSKLLEQSQLLRQVITDTLAANQVEKDSLTDNEHTTIINKMN